MSGLYHMQEYAATQVPANDKGPHSPREDASRRALRDGCDQGGALENYGTGQTSGQRGRRSRLASGSSLVED